MSVRWERLAGDTSTFAIKLAFATDPHEGIGASDDMAASWGSIQLWVNGVNLCAHVDDGELIEASHWYLLPALEWFAREWNALFHEAKPPAATDAYDAASVAVPWVDVGDWFGLNRDVISARYWEWRERHAMRSARDGGLYPDVFIRRYRDKVEISWSPRSIAGADDIRFQAPSGRSRLPPRPVSDAIYAAASEAAAFLAQENKDSSRLASLSDRYERLPSARTSMNALPGWPVSGTAQPRP